MALSKSPTVSLTLALTLAAVLGGSLSHAHASGAPAYEIERIEGSTIRFKPLPGNAQPPAPLVTEFEDISSLGLLRPEEAGEPHLILSVRKCQGCADDRQLALVKQGGGKPIFFVYPGRLIDSSTRTVLMNSRAFFGRCLGRKARIPGEALVIFQSERIERKRRGIETRSSVYLVDVTENGLREKLLERRLPRIEETLKQVRRGECREISGRNRYSGT